MRASFADQTKARVASLFQVIANKMGLPATTQPLGLMMVERGGGIAVVGGFGRCALRLNGSAGDERGGHQGGGEGGEGSGCCGASE